MRQKERINISLPGGLRIIGAFQDGKYKGVLRQDQIGEIERVEGDSLAHVESLLRDCANSEEVIASATNLVKEKHQQRLQGQGLSDAGYLDGETQKARVAHCYACKKQIDNIVDLICRACGWIICSRDGACGCGYES